MSFTLRAEGLTIPSGQTRDLPNYSDLQSTIMPVVSLQEGHLECWGTAVCVGAAGWFLTARHVVEDYLEAYGRIDNGTTGLFVLWETDELLPGGSPSDYLGAPLPVVYLHPHSNADLVALSVSLPAEAPERLRVATLGLRMPTVGEPLAVVGYTHMQLQGRVKSGEVSTVTYERTLSLGAGTVLECQHERLSSGLRGSPGVVTDAPIRPGMSGGPVIDQVGAVVGFASSSMEPALPAEHWNSYVALCGPAFELAVMAREYDDSELETLTIAELAAEEAILCIFDESASVDSELGIVVYPRPSPP